MITILGADALLYEILRDGPLGRAVEGRIYTGDGRPLGDDGEAVVINTIAVTHQHLPQLATSMVNIYVPDLHARINGVEQYKSNAHRLDVLTGLLLASIRGDDTPGVMLVSESASLHAITEVRQHCVSVRIGWNIVQVS